MQVSAVRLPFGTNGSGATCIRGRAALAIRCPPHIPTPFPALFPAPLLCRWGNPNQADYYHYIKSYAPVDNVRNELYPHMLVMGEWQ